MHIYASGALELDISKHDNCYDYPCTYTWYNSLHKWSLLEHCPDAGLSFWGLPGIGLLTDPGMTEEVQLGFPLLLPTLSYTLDMSYYPVQGGGIPTLTRQ